MKFILQCGCALFASFLMATPRGFAATVGTPASTMAIPTTMNDETLNAAKAEALDLLENRTAEGTEPGYYTAEARATFRAAIEAATTAEEITAATTAYKNAVCGVKLSDDENEYWYYITSGPAMEYCENSIIYDMSESAGEQLKWNDKAPEARGMWKFVSADATGETVKIVNKATGFTMRNPGGLGAKVVSAATLASGTSFSLVSLGEQRGYLIRQGNNNPVHADKIDVVVAWRTVTLGSASVWHFDPVSEEDLNSTGDSNEAYRLVWSDEFNTDGPIDDTYWTFEQGFVRNQEPQWYQSDNAVCKDGNLVITARKERVSNPNYVAGSSSWTTNRQYAEYTSSSVITKDKVDLLYGRMEIRAKIPTSSGAWPAIWCKGYPETNGSWPACGEIDILEFYSKSIFANVAWSNATGSSQWRTVKTAFTHFTGKDANWSDKFHVWRMDWDSLSIRLYLDDELLNVTSLDRTVQPVGDFCKTENPFKTPQFILLNLALRSSDGIDESVFPLNYYIDYVRFYQKNATPTTINTATMPEGAAWIVAGNDGYYIDMRAFNGAAAIQITDTAGCLVHATQAPASDGVFRLPTLPKGIYIVTATDGTQRLNRKIAM